MATYGGDSTFVYVPNARSGGISTFLLEPSGRLRDLGAAAAPEGVQPLAASPDRRFLYASIRSEPYSVASFAMDRRTGGLELLSVVPAPAAMTYISVDATGRFLLGASYQGNVICVLPIGKGGFVQPEPVELIRTGRNPHCILADPSNRFVFVPNLGSDHINQFVFDERTGSLSPNRPALAPAAHVSGPRHMCFSPDNRFAYVLTELSGQIVCHALDAGAGVLTAKQSVSIMPPGSTLPPASYVPPTNPKAPGDAPKIWAADIRITPNGKFIYASERSTSILSCFAIDAPTGTMTCVGAAETEAMPRGFNICPKGRFVIAAGEKSDHVSVHAIDQATGMLTRLGRYPVGKMPTWVEIVDLG